MTANATAAPLTGLVSIPRACQLTGLSRDTLRRYELRGDFPRRHRLSHRVAVYRAQEIAEWLENPSGWTDRNRAE